MFVLSVEGGAHMDKGLWTTHKVLGVFETEEAAIFAIPTDFDDEDIVVVTDVVKETARRIPFEEFFKS